MLFNIFTSHCTLYKHNKIPVRYRVDNLLINLKYRFPAVLIKSKLIYIVMFSSVSDWPILSIETRAFTRTWIFSSFFLSPRCFFSHRGLTRPSEKGD